MRVNRIVCPKCQASLTSKAGVEAGTSIACPKCKHKFAVAAPPEETEVVDDFDFVNDAAEETPKKKPLKPAAKKPVEEEEEEAPKKKPLKPAAKKPVEPVDDEDEEEKPKPKRRPRDEEDDEEDEKPKPKKRQEEDDEEEERPKAKKGKRDEDDDDDDRPRKKKKKRRGDDEELGVYGKLKANIWVRVSVLGVLLAVLGVVIYLRFVKDKNESSPNFGQTNQPEDDTTKPITKDQLGKQPKVPPKKPADELSKFQGAWNASRATANGAEVPANELSALGFIVKGNQWMPQADPNDIAKFTFDPNKTPAEIDFVDKKNELNRGIYRFGPGDTLELCMNTKNGGERPKDFSAPKGSTMVLMVLKRGKQ